MSIETPPLNLLVAPDEYLCTWLLPSHEHEIREYPGAIDLRASRPPIGSVHGDVPLVWAEHENGERSAGFPQRRHYSHLRARLANGFEADLVDVEVSYWSAEHGRISAASATIGASPGPRGFGWPVGRDAASQPAGETERSSQSIVPTYPRASVQVGALDALAGASPFASWQFPTGDGSRHLEGVWSITGNPESSQEWTDEHVRLRLEYDASVGVGDRYAFRFVVSPVVRLETQEPLTVREWVDQWVVPLRRIASIATGSSQELTYLAVEAPGIADRSDQPDATVPGRYWRRQVYGTGILQEPYQSNSRAVQQAATALHLAVDEVSLLDMIRWWQSLEAGHHPLIETYGAMLSATEEHPRSRFLLLVQAMEGLHGYETAQAYAERQERHSETRKIVLDAVTEAGCLTAKQRSFLKTNLARRPLRGLDQALRHLLESLPVDLTPQLLNCDLVAEAGADANGSEQQRVAWALSQVRNDLAHGNRGYDTYALHQAVGVLERIVRAHALRLLGCPETVLRRACESD